VSVSGQWLPGPIRMLKASAKLRTFRILMVAACLAVGGAALAPVMARETIDTRVPRDPLRHMIANGFVGGLTGVAVGGGVLGLMSAAGHGQHDWVSVLATSAGVGFAAGVLWGAIESKAGPPSPLALRPAKDGLSFADQHLDDRSGTVMLPFFGRRF
jgi:hypothetical protein